MVDLLSLSLGGQNGLGLLDTRQDPGLAFVSPVNSREILMF